MAPGNASQWPPGKTPVRCSQPDCLEIFTLADNEVGLAVPCPACLKACTAKPLDIWLTLDRRQQDFIRNQDGLAGSRPALARHAELASRDLTPFHKPRDPQDASWFDKRHDVQYEAGAEYEMPQGVRLTNVAVALDDLRSQWNVGSIFRTADGLGCGALHLCGITPIPPARGILRVSLSAETYVPWDYHAHVVDVLAARKSRGFSLVALEQTADAMPINDFDPPEKIVLVVGNEVAGVSREALECCETRLCIPMAGRKASLNAAVAFGIAVAAIRERWLVRWMPTPSSGRQVTRHDRACSRVRLAD